MTNTKKPNKGKEKVRDNSSNNKINKVRLIIK